MFTKLRKRLRWAGPVALVVALIASVLGISPANAAPAAPGGLTPNSQSAEASANPILSWNRVAGATGYDVEVSATSDFANPLYKVTTTNRRATPTSQLPMSKVWWRVRTRNSTTTSGWATTSFTRSKIAGPTLQSPADGALLKQPNNPPLLRWEPITGATNYTVELDRGTTADWVDTVTYSTQTTSLVVPDPQENGQYWWRVRAEIGSGQSTQTSAERSYTVGPLPVAAGTAPINGESTEEVVLEWDPVAGAVSYDIRVSTDDSFNTIIDERVVKGTRYSPPKTYNVDDFWWQVRARNVFGKAKEWADVTVKHQFTRKWEGPGAKPELLYPADAVSPSVGDDFFYQWTPSRLATRYRLDVGTDRNFSPNTFKSCFTTQTTYTPGFKHPGKPADLCMPEAKQTYYWRVKALDSWKGEAGETCTDVAFKSCEIQGVYSDIRTFVYTPGSVEQISPVGGATVDIPTLRWRPALDADKYEVTVKWSGGSKTVTTFSTSWTATDYSGNALDPTKGPFTWTVQAVDHNGFKSPLGVFGGGETFNLSGNIPTTGAAPLTVLAAGSNGAPTVRFPELRWEPVQGAAYYKLAIGTAGSGGVYELADKFPYPAGTDTSDDFLASGTYDWLIAAYDKSGNKLDQNTDVSPTPTFTINELVSTSGQRVALDGLTFTTGVSCDRSLVPDDANVCTGTKATPVIDWAPVPGVGYYMIYLSRDRNFQNMVYGSYSDSTKIPVTTNTMWTPTEALPDSQAGVPYHWYIRPCKTSGICAPDPQQANNAFDKKSNRVEPVSPVTGADSVVPEVKTNAVTFDWIDYLETNKEPAAANGITGETPSQAARSYHIQVSTSRAFTTLVDDQYVDQTTYTAFDRMYPEGQLYWRIQAVDGSGNGLAWSDPMEFTKASPKPLPDGPSGSVSATQPFSWEPAPYAASYDLEVYKNNDTAASSSNRVIGVNSLQTSYSWNRPLSAGTTYVWRVRRVDSSNNKGGWSQWTSFRVTDAAPAFGSPASGAWVRTNDALFTWSPTAGATSYLFERRLVGAAYNSETVRTASAAWAPYQNIPTGKWEWRVSSLDAAGNVIQSSEWRGFSVDATSPTVTRVWPSGYSVKPGASLNVRFSEPVWHVSGTTMRLFKKGSRRSVTARVTLSSDRRTATLNPSNNLRRGTYYELKLSSAISDRQGNRLRAYTTMFRTR